MANARFFAVLLTLCLASSAQAQAPTPSTESVTVTSTKAPPEKLLHDFIASYTKPSPASGKVARWHDGICPVVTGLPPAWNKMVTARVQEIAKTAGAPVAADGCRANIDIVFTKNPQVLLDSLRGKKSFLLGYHDLINEEKLAKVSHPVQAWYMTQTVDAAGSAYVDDKLHGQGVSLTSGGGSSQAGNSFQFPSAHVEQWSGSHLADNRRSELRHVVIVADLDRIEGIKLSALADDMAMLSLAQTAAFDACQPVSSITNITASPCDAALKTDAASDNDLAYLHALYAMDPNDSLGQQKSKMAYEMKKSLTRESAGAR